MTDAGTTMRCVEAVVGGSRAFDVTLMVLVERSDFDNATVEPMTRQCLPGVAGRAKRCAPHLARWRLAIVRPGHPVTVVIPKDVIAESGESLNVTALRRADWNDGLRVFFG
jgi:hypothetical protein